MHHQQKQQQQDQQAQEALWLLQCRKKDGTWISEKISFFSKGGGILSSSSEQIHHPINNKNPNSILLPSRNSSSFLYYYYSLYHIPIQILSDLFLPRDYPHSVHEGYMEYQMYDSIQGLCSYVRGTITTSALFTIAGVGDATATTWNAAIQWAMKDGMGMIGGLVFSYYTSTYFDSYVKEFRLFADLMNDVGLFLDMICPYILLLYKVNHHQTQNSSTSSSSSSLVWMISSIATLCRVMCGMAAGATKGSITQHFSKHNLADLNSKEGTQETLISLVGMIIGIFLARYLQQVERSHGKHVVQSLSWIIFTILTWIHVWTNYKAVSILRLRSLNQLRTEYALDPLIRFCTKVIEMNRVGRRPWKEYFDNPSCTQDFILPPQLVFENFLSSMFFKRKVPIHIGSDFHKIMEHTPSVQLQHALRCDYRNEKYILFINVQHEHRSKPRPLYVSLRVGATEDDILKAVTHALILRSLLLDCKCILDENSNIWAHQLVNCIFENEIISMKKMVEIGWESKLYFPSQTTYRVDWGEEHFSKDVCKEE